MDVEYPRKGFRDVQVVVLPRHTPPLRNTFFDIPEDCLQLPFTHVPRSNVDSDLPCPALLVYNPESHWGR